VAQHGWRKKALFLAQDGTTLHTRSALCTHLGCCVEWNPLSE
jgi:Rieske Fe-S protein